jgi:hypothetical protein
MVPLPGPREPLRVLGLRDQRRRPTSSRSPCSRHLLDDLPIHVEIAGMRMQATELLALAQTEGFSVVCFADLPPSPSSKTRYLVKRLRAALPDVRILVGRWGPPALADESTQVLRDTGANLVASTLLETRTYLAGLVEIPRIPAPETNVAHAA